MKTKVAVWKVIIYLLSSIGSILICLVIFPEDWIFEGYNHLIFATVASLGPVLVFILLFRKI